MKLSKKFLSLVLIAVLLAASCCTTSAYAAGSTYYIDSINGDDSNNGTSTESPWKTIEKASQAEFSSGDRILLKAGCVFDGSFTANGSGTADNPITIGSYGDIDILGKPIIRSNEDKALVSLHNVVGWTVENIEFTSPNGMGIYVLADGNRFTTDIAIKNCTFHDIFYKRCETYNGLHCPIMLLSSGAVSRVRNIHISGCNIYDCAYGINMGGLTYEGTPDLYVSPEESYNTNFIIENTDLNNILYDGIIIGSVYGMIIRNCSIINASLNDDYYTAPIWSHHASNYVVENCEIAGAENEKDGMAVDFDGWTTDSVYQYVYSHDNVRFIRNCCYDNYTKNENCTVRYCLSVNDNKGENSLAQLLTSSAVNYAEDEKPVAMDNFKFYNNTLINCSDIYCEGLSNSLVANNIFVGKSPVNYIRYVRKSVEDGKSVITEFDGSFTDNCFCNIGSPYIAKNSVIGLPGFAGTDYDNKESFRLSADSKLIGRGIQAEENMGEHDFYGNALTDTHNIGCYEGSGETEKAGSSFLTEIFLLLKTYLSNAVSFIANCNSKYWLF